jgi:hypothetical protein
MVLQLSGGRERRNRLDLGDGFDEILIDGDEIRAILVVDDDIGKTDEQPLLLVDRVRDPVSHGRNQKVANIHAVDRTDANANLLAFWHRSPSSGAAVRLALTTQKLLTPAQLLIFMLAHFLSALLQHTRHTVSPLRARV